MCSEVLLKKFELQPIDKLEKLPTKRLLAYFKKHRKSEYHFVCGCCGEHLYYTEQNKIDDKMLSEYFKEVRELLNSREHVKKWKN